MFIPIGIDRPYYRKPYVTYTIMGVCTALELFRLGLAKPDDAIVSLGYVAGHGSLMTLFTSMFTHAGLAHLLGNMLFLWISGIKVEDALGWWRYLLLYLGCGVAANMIFVWLSPPIPMPMVGASGAIAGMMGAYLVLYPHSRVNLLYFLLGLQVAKVPAWVYLGYWFGWEFFKMIVMPEGSGVAFGAHVGGFFAGTLWLWSFFGWDSGDELEMASADVVFDADAGI
jgi:membrane associated rhomboid family serine protease